MQIQLVRSATIRVSLAGTVLLIDPWLAARGEGRSYAGRVRSPLVDLPMPVEDVVDGIDAVLVSHLHSDHIDAAGAQAIPPGTPVLAPRRDVAGLRALGVANVVPVEGSATVGAIEIVLTPGRHGPDDVLPAMGEVSGFILRAPGEPSLYWVGDSILCDEVRAVIRSERPEVIVVHACGADWEGTAPLVMDAGMVLDTGRRMLALGTHPRIAAMLLAAAGPASQALACDLAALLEARDPLRSRSDALAARWRALAGLRRGAVGVDASRAALSAIDAAARQWRRRLRVDRPPATELPAHALGDLLAHAFPERIAARHASDLRRYQLASGRMLRLAEDSDLIGEPWLVASELRMERGDALLLRGAPLDEDALRRDFGERFSERDETRWDEGRRALVSERVSRFAGIVLDSRPAGRPDPAAAAAALTDAVRALGLGVLPWSRDLVQWRARVASLREWMPGLGLPDLRDAALLADLDGWLRPAFEGLARLDALGADALSDVLRARLPWPLQQKLDALAPVRIQVPSGQARAIVYAIDEDGQPLAPVLAVKVQELFGLADTPRIADGRVPLVLHLLSPAGRPLQVTSDLRSFWDRTWPEVRREMKGRYPRHPWPEDPWNAVPTHRTRPRAR